MVNIADENKDILAFNVFHNFTTSLSNSSLPTALKYSDVGPVFKRQIK